MRCPPICEVFSHIVHFLMGVMIPRNEIFCKCRPLIDDDLELAGFLPIRLGEIDRQDAVLEGHFSALRIDLLRQDDRAGEPAPIAFLVEIVLVLHGLVALARAAS